MAKVSKNIPAELRFDLGAVLKTCKLVDTTKFCQTSRMSPRQWMTQDGVMNSNYITFLNWVHKTSKGEHGKTFLTCSSKNPVFGVINGKTIELYDLEGSIATTNYHWSSMIYPERLAVLTLATVWRSRLFTQEYLNYTGEFLAKAFAQRSSPDFEHYMQTFTSEGLDYVLKFSENDPDHITIKDPKYVEMTLKLVKPEEVTEKAETVKVEEVSEGGQVRNPKFSNSKEDWEVYNEVAGNIHSKIRYQGSDGDSYSMSELLMEVRPEFVPQVKAFHCSEVSRMYLFKDGTWQGRNIVRDTQAVRIFLENNPDLEFKVLKVVTQEKQKWKMGNKPEVEPCYHPFKVSFVPGRVKAIDLAKTYHRTQLPTSGHELWFNEETQTYIILMGVTGSLELAFVGRSALDRLFPSKKKGKPAEIVNVNEVVTAPIVEAPKSKENKEIEIPRLVQAMSWIFRNFMCLSLGEEFRNDLIAYDYGNVHKPADMLDEIQYRYNNGGVLEMTMFELTMYSLYDPEHCYCILSSDGSDFTIEFKDRL